MPESGEDRSWINGVMLESKTVYELTQTIHFRAQIFQITFPTMGIWKNEWNELDYMKLSYQKDFYTFSIKCCYIYIYPMNFLRACELSNY